MLLKVVLCVKRQLSLRETSSIETESLRLKMEQPMNGLMVVKKLILTQLVSSQLLKPLKFVLKPQSVAQNESEDE